MIFNVRKAIFLFDCDDKMIKDIFICFDSKCWIFNRVNNALFLFFNGGPGLKKIYILLLKFFVIEGVFAI